jgi:hypothetical protein
VPSNDGGHARRRVRLTAACAALIASIGWCSAVAASDAEEPIDLRCGEPVVRELGDRVTDRYQFGAQAGDAVAIEAVDLTGVLGLIDVRLYAPDGGDPLAETCSGRIALALPQTGPYTLEVTDCLLNDENQVGTYAVTLNSTSTTLNGAPNCGLPVACNADGFSGLFPEMTPKRPGVFGGVIGYALTTSAGMLHLVSDTTSPDLGPVEMRVYSPRGEMVAASCESTIDVEVGAGLHSLLLNPCTNVSAGPFSIAVDAPCVLGCDQPLIRAVKDVGVKDVAPFEVGDGEIVSVTVVSGTSQSEYTPAWQLLDGHGTPVPGYGRFITRAPHTLCGPLAAAGNPYSLAIGDPDAEHTGKYKVALQRVTASAACENQQLQCGESLDAVLDDPLDTDLLSFSVVDGETVNVGVSAIAAADAAADAEFTPGWRVLDASGRPAGGPCAHFSSAEPLVTCDPLPESGNPYRLEVGSADLETVGTYRARVVRDYGCGVCRGDCNNNGIVAIDEIVRGMRVALGSASLDTCPSFDADEDGLISVDELITAVNNALLGCH